MAIGTLVPPLMELAAKRLAVWPWAHLPFRQGRCRPCTLPGHGGRSPGLGGQRAWRELEAVTLLYSPQKPLRGQLGEGAACGLIWGQISGMYLPLLQVTVY